MLRHTSVEDELPPQSVDELRRKVAWQVSIAYGLPLEEAREWAATPSLAAAEPEPVAPLPVAPLPQPEPEPEPELPPAAAAAPEPERFVLPTLTELERLVADATDASPVRVEEWRWYLFYLRDFAQADGTLDDTFSLLVESAFGDLLQAQPGVH
jgi:hypothetical protein